MKDEWTRHAKRRIVERYPDLDFEYVRGLFLNSTFLKEGEKNILIVAGRLTLKDLTNSEWAGRYYKINRKHKIVFVVEAPKKIITIYELPKKGDGGNLQPLVNVLKKETKDKECKRRYKNNTKQAMCNKPNPLRDNN